MLTLNFLMLPILHLESFTLDAAWMFWPMSMGEQVVFHWSTLEESCLPNTGWAPGNLFIVAIPHSCSLPELVHLGWSWYILPMQCIFPYTVECPSLLLEWWEEVSYNGGSMINHAHLSPCMKGYHLQLEVPLHMACLPIDLWYFSSPDMSPSSPGQDCQAPMKWLHLS